MAEPIKTNEDKMKTKIKLIKVNKNNALSIMRTNEDKMRTKINHEKTKIDKYKFFRTNKGHPL